MSAIPSGSASRRARQAFKIIKKLPPDELGIVANLIANDDVLLDLILEKSESFQNLVETLKKRTQTTEKLHEAAEAIKSLEPDIMKIIEDRNNFSVMISRLLKRIKERNPKPRNTDRDAEIVRLYDEESKTFGEIPRLLILTNLRWCGKNGNPITRDAAEHAYHRYKGKPTK